MHHVTNFDLKIKLASVYGHSEVLNKIHAVHNHLHNLNTKGIRILVQTPCINYVT